MRPSGARAAAAIVGVLSVLACACNTVAHDGRSAPPRTQIAADEAGSGATTASAADAGGEGGAAAAIAENEAPLPWGTRAPKDGVLFPIVDGMCIHGEIYALENGPLFAYGSSRGAYSRGGATTTAFIRDDGLEPQPNVGFGATFDFWAVRALGGRYPDRMWALVDVSSRMVSAGELRAGTSKANEWKVLIDSGTKLGDAGNMAQMDVPLRNFAAPLLLDDGSVLLPEETSVRRTAGETTTHSFRLLSASGALVPNAKVPGADLAKLAADADSSIDGVTGIVQMSGEVLGVKAEPTAKLIRWSPSKAVDDLKIPLAKPYVVSLRPGIPSPVVRIASGKKRAFVQVGSEMFVYDGEKIEKAKVTPKLTGAFTWTVGDGDALYVALASKTLVVESAKGELTEEPMPAAGKLHASAHGGALWLTSDRDRQLHRRTAKGWEAVPLPPPPFGNALRGPVAVESIKIFGDDVFVNARRVEKGWGWRDPEPYRVVYRTKRPKQVMRCQDVRNDGTGKGLFSWPPAAEETCTAPFVVIMREDIKTPPKTYPNVAAKLRGKTEYGDKLTFVSFEGRASMNLGIPMTDVAKARAMATHLSKSLDIRADVVCGRPEAVQQVEYDVVKGTPVVAEK